MKQLFSGIGGIRRDKVCLIASLCALFFSAQCGIKGAPEPSRLPEPPPVNDLTIVRVGDNLRLSWSLPKQDDGVFGGLDQFKVYKFRTHRLVTWCPDCPMTFRHFLDIKVSDPWPARMEDGRIVFDDIIETDFHYAYKVVVHHRSGGSSRDSNIAAWPEFNE